MEIQSFTSTHVYTHVHTVHTYTQHRSLWGWGYDDVFLMCSDELTFLYKACTSVIHNFSSLFLFTWWQKYVTLSIYELFLYILTLHDIPDSSVSIICHQNNVVVFDYKGLMRHIPGIRMMMLKLSADCFPDMAVRYTAHPVYSVNCLPLHILFLCLQSYPHHFSSSFIPFPFSISFFLDKINPHTIN